jgi:hypothetical protein
MDTEPLTSASVCLPSNVSNSRFSVLKNDSAHALSQQFPVRLMLCRTEGHLVLSASRKDAAQYGTPRSE